MFRYRSFDLSPRGSRARRGVLLLVVMALLALMTLLGLTLVLATSQARMSAIAAARANNAGNRDHSEMQEVLNQIVRGSRDPDSVVQAHSLLEDLYGAPQAFGSVADIAPMAGGQLLQMTVLPEAATAAPLASASGAYTGCVITMLSGNTAGRSSRVTDYRYNSGASYLQATAFDGILPAIGDRFVINGRPYAGTGFGFNPALLASATTPWPSTPLLNATDATVAVGPNLLALLPNHSQIDWPAQPAVYQDPAGPGGANETYDAVDFQNMLLGLVYRAGGTTVVIPSLHRPELLAYWENAFPGSLSNSAVRRKLILRPEPGDHVYQDLNGNGNWDIGEPDFTGKPFDPVNGPWDIDNDNDGVLDSIWVDVGLQVQTAPDGTKYKTLAAILCIDQDGKVNLNAHGTLAHLDPNRYSPVENLTYVYAPFAGTPGSAGLSTLGQVQPEANVSGSIYHRYFPIGPGMGPAEINPLYTLIAGAGTADKALAEYAHLLLGVQDTSVSPPNHVEGRYGEILRPGVNANAPSPAILPYATNFNPSWTYAAARPGWSYWFDPATNIVSDPLAMARASGVRPFLLQPALQTTPAYFFSYAGGASQYTPSSYSTPYDLHARGILALDLRGQPYYTGSANLPWTTQLTDPTIMQLINDAIDTPYELDLSQNAQHDGRQTTSGVATIDQPFTPAELEGLLRNHDQDQAALDGRLRLKTLAPAILGNESARLQTTTESWDLNVPNVTALTLQQIQDLQSFYGSTGLPARYNNLSIVDLARARIFRQIASQTSTSFSATPPASIGSLGNAYALDNALFGNLINNPGTFPALPVWPLLAPEVVMGQRLDINRPLGNGVDDNGNGAVDDWHEAAVGEVMVSPTNNQGGLSAAVQLDHNNDGFLANVNDPTYADTRARQLLARHLYTMTMLMIDDSLSKASIFNGSGAIFPPPWPQYSTLAGTPPYYRQQAAYVVAQWAINAVDFRDSDSTMTAFEFDLTPFQDDDNNAANGTWDVDDIVSTQEDAAGSYQYRGVVWGCERPELVLTETIATHDRGTDDTQNAADISAGNPDTYTNDTTATVKDKDYDQVRRPRGSLIVELLNVTNPWDAPHRDLQYDGVFAANGLPQPWAQADYNSNQGYGVNLAQVAVGAPLAAGPTTSPVWRLVISYSTNYDESGFYAGSPGAGALAIDPRVPVLPSNYVHRAVYFAPYNANFVAASSPSNMNEIPLNQSFFLDSGLFGGSPRALMLPPSQYAVVGPAAPSGGIDTIYLGQNNKPATAANNNPIQIQLGNQGNSSSLVNITNGGAPFGSYGIPGAMKPAIGVPIETTWLNGGNYVSHSAGGATRTLRMSVSEPDNGYPVWNGIIADDGFYYTQAGTPIAGQKFPQIPFDSSDPANTNVTNPNRYVAPAAGATNNAPVTTPSYTVIYLQRLADPVAPWDATLNPYLTVDRMPVDLTAYTGENQPVNDAKATAYEPTTGGYQNANGSPLSSFSTRRRGYNATGAHILATENAPNFFTPLPVTLPVNAGKFGITNGATTTSPMVGSTLGYLNTEYGAAWSNGNAGVNIGMSGVNPAVYNGDPTLPAPWITWNDRPYVSQYELMLVPASSPSSLFADFGMVNWTSEIGQAAPTNEYDVGYAYFNSQLANGAMLPWAQFRHLLNFYDTQQGAGNALSNMYRLFDYVAVPSRFAGTQTMLSPTQFVGTTAGPAAGAAPHNFHPPFNWLSRYREPGRINLNTLFGKEVFEGLMDDYPGWNSLWQNFIDSRRGYGALGGPILTPNLAMPTFFANPFRPEGASAMVPLASMMHSANFGINSTLQRTQAPFSNPGSAAYAASALLDDKSFDPFNSTATYSYGTSQTPYRDAGRSPYFQYQALQRLGNLVTNRSNVYAIWITLGQFEVKQVAITPSNPDGYKIGPEVGTAVGDVKRQRAFYLYDRSIPVGFIRGQNLNIERGVLIERTLQE